MKQNISFALDAVLNGRSIDYDAVCALAQAKGADLWDLFAAAGRVRERFRGETVDICSIVNAKSGACSENCSYCAQSVHHSTGAAVYPLISVGRMTEAAISSKRNGARRFCIVTSGRGIDSHADLETIAEGIRKVRDIGLSPCATLGTLSRDQLSYLQSAGLQRYHHNIETSREYFSQICTTHCFDERIEVLKNARSLGLSACSGGILGMGESMQDRIKMAFTLRELDVDSVPINFLMPITGTPLGERDSHHAARGASCTCPVSSAPAQKGDPCLRGQGNNAWPAPSAHICSRRGRIYDRQLSYNLGARPGRRP